MTVIARKTCRRPRSLQAFLPIRVFRQFFFRKNSSPNGHSVEGFVQKNEDKCKIEAWENFDEKFSRPLAVNNFNLLLQIRGARAGRRFHGETELKESLVFEKGKILTRAHLFCRI